MRFMLDTDSCIYVIKRRPPGVLRRLRLHNVGDVGISSITLAELAFGAAKSQHPEANRAALDEFVLPLEVAPFDALAAKSYGTVRAELERKGALIGPLDTLIAAHALSLSVTLVTHNTREFSRVAGLLVADWTASQSRKPAVLPEVLLDPVQVPLHDIQQELRLAGRVRSSRIGHHLHHGPLALQGVV